MSDEVRITCYRCELLKPLDEMNWRSPDNPKRGLYAKCHEIGKKKEEMENESTYPGEPMHGFDHIKMKYAEKIVCPHCGHVEDPHENDGWEDNDLWQPSDGVERNCESCEKEFLMQVNVTFTYHTKIEVSWEEAVQALAAEEG